MGCGGSKVDDLPLVNLCRERRDLIRAAADHRYSLAAAHVSYIRALRVIGVALHRFVNEELVVVSSTVPSSPILTLPVEGKKESIEKTSSSISLCHSLSQNSPSNSHLHFSSSSDSGSLSGNSPRISSPSHPSHHDSPVASAAVNYTRSTAIPSMVYEEEDRSPETVRWAGHPYSSYPQQYNGVMTGFFGLSMGSHPPPSVDYRGSSYQYSSVRAVPPQPPSPPQVSTWDFLDPFNSYKSMYQVPAQSTYSFGSSPDSKEVREREGIPDLEDEARPVRDVNSEKKLGAGEIVINESCKDYNSKVGPSQTNNGDNLLQKENKTSPHNPINEAVGSKSSEEESSSRKKGVSFEIEEPSAEDGQPSELNDATTLSTHMARDILEVVMEIRDQFETASDSGKEVLALLEAGKLCYRPKKTIFKVISSSILNAIASPTLTSQRPPSKGSQLTVASALKIGKAFHGDFEKFIEIESSNLSMTLEKLYAWEKKLYAEVKDEEKLRVIYEKKCKRLKILDDRGAEPDKLDAIRASIKKLLTKISIAIKAVETISNKIHKLRDEELQPQLTEFIQRWIRMWKAMLICHQKQCRVIAEGKTLDLVANSRIQSNSSIKATIELEEELLNWCSCFSNWIGSQKAYVETLNGWLLRCILHEPEETPDGIFPFSPSRVGAPPVFTICNDWYHIMAKMSEMQVTEAMQAFAASMHRLWECQDEQQRQKLKAEYLSKDFEKRLRSLREEESKVHWNQSLLDKSKPIVSGSKDSGVLLADQKMSLDSVKKRLDSVKKRLDEEIAKHQEAVKLVHETAFNSLQLGLKPIFEAIENFTSETTKAYETLRIQNVGNT